MFHTCGTGPAAEHRARPVAPDGSKPLTVDIHCHCQIYPVSNRMKVEADRVGHAALAFGNPLTKSINQQQLLDIEPKMQSLDERLADMDQMGVDVQAISVPPYQFYYWAEPEIGRQAAQDLNTHLTETVAQAPDRLIAMGTVPLQDTQMAVAELERCIHDLGMRGVEISTRVNDEELSADRLAPFFAKAEELGCLIFIHPEGFSHPQRLTNHYFVNLVGHPVESTLAIGHLIFGGVLDRYPGLKICIAHGGGYVPAYAGRMDHGHRARADCRVNIDRSPSQYMKKLYFDTMVFEPDQLAYLIEKFGADHVLLGTDYPYDMGENNPLDLVAKVESLDPKTSAAICGGNAVSLLGLDR